MYDIYFCDWFSLIKFPLANSVSVVSIKKNNSQHSQHYAND